MRGAARDTDDTFFFAVYNDCHVDAGQNAGVEFVIIYDNNVFFAPNDPVRRLVIGPYAVFAAACDDDAGLIHDIDVVFCVVSNLVDEFLRHFRSYHGMSSGSYTFLSR